MAGAELSANRFFGYYQSAMDLNNRPMRLLTTHKDRRCSSYPIIMALLIVAVVALGGCSADPPANANSNTASVPLQSNDGGNSDIKVKVENTSVPAPVDTTNTSAPGVDANVRPQEISELPPPPPGNNEKPISMAEAKKRRMEQFRNSNSTGGLPPGLEGQGQPQARPAPDNSEYFVTLTDVARETRRFKSHTLLDKVEKSTNGKSISITAFLKDGRKVPIDPTKIKNFPTATAAQFLASAGLK